MLICKKIRCDVTRCTCCIVSDYLAGFPLCTLLYGDDTGYPHDGRADKDSYPHDGRADKNSYPHDGRADKDSYPHDRRNQYIMLSL